MSSRTIIVNVSRLSLSQLHSAMQAVSEIAQPNNMYNLFTWQYLQINIDPHAINQARFCDRLPRNFKDPILEWDEFQQALGGN